MITTTVVPAPTAEYSQVHKDTTAETGAIYPAHKMHAIRVSLLRAVLVNSLSMLAYQVHAFFVQTAVLPCAPHTVVRSSGPSAASSRERRHRATVEGAQETVAVKADVWEGFGEEDHERFLDEYWQKKPLLIRQAVQGFGDLLSKDELAGLACCPDVESRVVTGGKMVEEAGKDWEVEHGPFEEHVFSELGETHWTLLVNEVNRHVPEVSDLLSKFRFVPTWRVDDVMVSYAPEGGSVGPHVDNYDVFLLQGAGKRRWSIEETATSGDKETTRSIDGIDVRVLSDFKEAQAWVLEPGDALYLPPRIAHHGVSQDDECMTYSVGFRAPSTRDLVTFFGDHVASTVANADAFYQDPDLKKQENHGLIARDAVLRAKGMLREALLAALDDEEAFDTWFGGHVTRSRRDHTGYPMPMDDEDGLSFGYQFPEDVTAAVRRAFRRKQEAGASAGGGEGVGPFVYHAEGLTFAFVEHQGDAGGATLFVDGNGFPLPGKMDFAAGLVCKSPRLSPRELGPALEGQQGEGVAELLHLLLRDGYLYPADD